MHMFTHAHTTHYCCKENDLIGVHIYFLHFERLNMRILSQNRVRHLITRRIPTRHLQECPPLFSMSMVRQRTILNSPQSLNSPHSKVLTIRLKLSTLMKIKLLSIRVTMSSVYVVLNICTGILSIHEITFLIAFKIIFIYVFSILFLYCILFIIIYYIV